MSRWHVGITLNPCNATLIEFVKEGRIREHNHPTTKIEPVSMLKWYLAFSANTCVYNDKHKNYYACLLVRGFSNIGLTPNLVELSR